MLNVKRRKSLRKSKVAVSLYAIYTQCKNRFYFIYNDLHNFHLKDKQLATELL